MSTIYSAGQYDDAFTPKRLGNWESTAKESYPFIKSPKQYTPQVIVDSRGHLLPWVQRDRNTLWGLLNHHLRSKYNRARNMAVSGPGKQTNVNGGVPNNQAVHQSIRKRLRKLPKFAPRKVDTSPPPDLLLEYLKHLSLPIVWIIGPSTKYTFQKRKQFSKQLATSLGFGYVSLEDKVQEWKDRQQICTCGSSSTLGSGGTSAGGVPSSPPTGPLHSLALTSIAPSKLPTNVPPFISPNIPSPPETSPAEANEYILSILESQRIAFDTAMPIERNKMLELYKFAMAECLPCSGFIMDSVPFDLVEGLQFEKVFYPAALAIYFTEGVPQKKQKVKPKDRRITAGTATSIHTAAKKNLLSPLEFLERNRRQGANVYLRPKSHKRLGAFSLAEGDKICKHFGSKTIRIINAEDVEKDTMEFLNQLVKRNLERYQDIAEGKAKLDLGQGHREEQLLGSIEIVRSGQPPARKPVSSAYSSSSFIHEDEAKALERLEEFEDATKLQCACEQPVGEPPALVTAHLSETSLFTIPNIFTAHSDSSLASSPRSARENLDIQVEVEEAVKSKQTSPPSSSSTKTKTEHFGAGDHVAATSSEKYTPGRRSAELWERIIKLESKVAELSTQEEDYQQQDNYHHHHHEHQECGEVEEEEVVEEVNEEIAAFYLPPPTAYAERRNVSDKEDEKKFTAAIRNAIGPNYCSPSEQEFNYFRDYQEICTGPLPQDFDYGASGDCGERRSSGSEGPPSLVSTYPVYYPSHSQQPKDKRKRKNRQMYSHSPPGFEEDPFYD